MTLARSAGAAKRAVQFQQGKGDACSSTESGKSVFGLPLRRIWQNFDPTGCVGRSPKTRALRKRVSIKGTESTVVLIVCQLPFSVAISHLDVAQQTGLALPALLFGWRICSCVFAGRINQRGGRARAPYWNLMLSVRGRGRQIFMLA